MKPNSPKISIIIPVLNEEAGLGKVLEHLGQTSDQDFIAEIICVDGGSRDETIKIATKNKATVISSKKGRARQMNTGAKHATGEILYFLHADTFPPKHFDRIVLKAIGEGYQSGCFRMKFDSKNPILRFFAWLSRINHSLCRGGDQSLFIKKELFEKTQGFNEQYLIYEDTEFIRRLYHHTKFKVLPHHVITSARKYREKGWLRVQFHFGMIHVKNYLGAGPDELYRYYYKHLLT
ncbi:TIGR04283 family arsenosugar biosynthesis glycosyltransferase [Flagellimonas allohymeniacidonis]|uniref:Glycosyltransferase n=1 Tax=Flagellimonas allohymeniacidonis TaxID=2517819 RepID=A0A4V2HSJ4_9FLAO|nr:TIGR04283 family arsenosugar biosynthesis glycosyltransferase [Allomuricauda hymeniacidonis]TAI48020.1 glycosyltransferase [Allomuricauda hymeniacidonis]